MIDYFDVIKSRSGIPVDDYWAMLWAQGMAGEKWQITTLTGLLPLSFLSKGEALTDYRIYGTENGAGVQTKNLFDITNVAQVTVPEVGNRYGVVYFGAGEYTIKTYGNTANYLYAYQYNENNERVAFVWIVQTPGARQYTFTLNSGDTLYLVAAIDSTTYNGAITLFTNWLPVVCNGSTAPASYIPPGYQIPLTVTSGEQSDTYPIYIGSTKLGAEEYVDYQEQKAYKRTENLWDGTYSAVGIFKANGDIGTNADYRVSDYIEIEGAITYSLTSDIARPTRTMYPVVWYDENKSFLRTASVESIPGNEKYDFSYAAVPNAKYVRFNYRVTDTDIMLVPDSTAPETYIPYLQPIDPPAPFPAITAYKGGNTLSSTETVGEVSVTGKIKETS